MSDERSIKPEAVRLTALAAEETSSADAPSIAAEQSRRRIDYVLAAAAAVLAVSALYVVFVVLPNAVTPPVIEGNPQESAVAPSAERAAAPDEQPAAPYEAAVDAQKEEFARDVLARIVELQGTLEGLRVDLWAAEDYEYAKSLGAEGDEAFALGKYELARERYRHAAAQLAALVERARTLSEAKRQEAQDALARGDPVAARKAIELLSAMYPRDAGIDHLADRLEVMPKALELIEAAKLAARNGELDDAANALRQALELDPERADARQALQTVSEQIATRDFRAAMSEGFSAIGRGEFERAERAFDRAAKLGGHTEELAEGRRQLEAARVLARIEQHREAAEQAMAGEDFAAAIESYRAALAIDGSLAFAQRGLRTAESWQALMAKIQAFLDDPGVLSNDETYAEAVKVFASASELPVPGPRTQARLDAFEKLLDVAATPIPVHLVSDDATDVVIYRVARLGKFRERTLKLRPGRYTVVGTRRGFRDVRSEIMVKPDMSVIDVRCTEPLEAAL